MAKIRMAQYGTKHGHASGKLQAMQVNDNVEIAGCLNPTRNNAPTLKGQAVLLQASTGSTTKVKC